MKRKRQNLLIQILLTAVLIWVIYKQLDNKNMLLAEWKHIVSENFSKKWFLLLLCVLLMPLNYLLESQKWYILVNRFENHSFTNAIKGILTGTTAGIITPARLGDFVGKLMYISPENNWKAVWSNLTAGIAQNLVVLAGGLVASIFLLDLIHNVNTQLSYVLVFGALAVLAILMWIFYNLHVLSKLGAILPDRSFLINIKKSVRVIFKFELDVLNKVLLLSLIRYIIFLLQYVLLLSFWGVDILWMIPLAIMVIYLVQTMMPLPPLLGLFFRGEIALVMLAPFSENGLSVMSAAFSLWIINLLVPALLGLFLLYKTNITKTLGYGN